MIDLTPMTESKIHHNKVFLSLWYSVAFGACFFPCAHALLGYLTYNPGVDAFGFNTISPSTSIRIGFTGGPFTSPLVTWLDLTSFDSTKESSVVSITTTLLLPMVILGVVQGFFGAMILDGGAAIVDGQVIPGALGVGGACIAGGVGASIAFAAMIIFQSLLGHVRRLTRCRQCAQSLDSTCNYILFTQDSRIRSHPPSRNQAKIASGFPRITCLDILNESMPDGSYLFS